MNEITGKLIRQAAAGNQEAITELYELTYSSIYKSVRAMVQDEDSVLDIVQDSYIKGFQSLDQLDKPENYRAWMKRIATNKAKDYLKKKKPILFSEMANEDGEEIDFRDERLDHCPEEIIDQQETTRLMNEILGTLSEEQRLVIGMFYYEEMTVREIAETLGCSENTVKSRLNYGRKKVEVKVRELEKKGTKLYSLAPLPFLLWLFRMDAQAAEIPSVAVWDSITTACVASGSTAGAGTAGSAAASTGAKAAATAGVKAAAGTGAKALTTKIIAGVLALTVVGGGAMVAVSNNDNKEEAPPTQQVLAADPIQETSVSETTEVSPVQVTAEEAYSPITENYKTVLSADSTTYLAAPENHFNGDHRAIFYYHTYHGDQFYYAYQDIDGNGMEELLIGFGTEGYIQIVDLYGFNGTQAVQLIDEPTLGDRSTLTILEDNTLSLFGGSSAAESSQTYWKIEGSSLVPAAPSSGAEVNNISWNLLEVSQTAPEQPSEEVPAMAALTGLYVSTQEGNGLIVGISEQEDGTILATFSSPVSDVELSYPLTYENGFWSLWLDGDLMLFNFTFREGYMLIEGSAPPEMAGYLGAYEKLQNNPLAEAPAAVSFDTILTDIQYVVENIPTEEYQNNQAYYDNLYPHLGDGVLWTLTFGPINGYEQAIWKTYHDIDNDGIEELYIGFGVSLGRPISLLAIYKENGEVIVGDMIYNYPLPEGLDTEGMPLAGWEYLCG